MSTHFRTLAIALAVSAAAALAAAAAQASDASGRDYEACLTAKAFAIELTGVEVDEVIAQAEHACIDARRGLTDAAVGEAMHKARLAVIQQRSNARNTRRRG